MQKSRTREYRTQYRLENLEKFLAKEKEQHQKHREQRNAHCREWHKRNRESELIKDKIWKIENKEQWLLWLSSIVKLECTSCGYNQSFSALDLHHIDPKKKDKNNRFSLFFTRKCSPDNQERAKKEIEGTTILCANCHRILHFG